MLRRFSLACCGRRVHAGRIRMRQFSRSLSGLGKGAVQGRAGLRARSFTSSVRIAIPPRTSLSRSASCRKTAAFRSLPRALDTALCPEVTTVLIEWRDATDNGVVPVKSDGKSNLLKRTRIHSGPDRLKGRYFDVSKPLLKAEVKPGTNPASAPFELTD